MPCEGESVIKGDWRVYIIAAAYILAKVTWDRLLHKHDEIYPLYNFKKHIGYVPKVPMEEIYEHGASPIHHQSFAPLKHMKFDEQGHIVGKIEKVSDTSKLTSSQPGQTKFKFDENGHIDRDADKTTTA